MSWTSLCCVVVITICAEIFMQIFVYLYSFEQVLECNEDFEIT